MTGVARYKREREPPGWAVHWLKLGKRVTRPGWNGKGMWLVLATLVRVVGALVTGKAWTCSQTDLLAEDWMVVE